MHLAQDRDKWQALVNTTMNFHVPYTVRNFLTKRVTTSFWSTHLFNNVISLKKVDIKCTLP